MTHEQFAWWRRVYEQEPWGETRADMRMAAQTVWLIRPHLKNPNDVDVPDLHYPYYPEEDDTLDRVAAIEAARKRLKDGSLDCKTRDPAND